MRTYSVYFKPQGKTVEVEKGTSLMDAAQKAGVFLDAPCGGKGQCGKCRVKVIEGEHRYQPSRLIARQEENMGIRLACLTTVEGDMTVEIVQTVGVDDIIVEDITADSTKKSRVKRAVQVLKDSGMKAENSFKSIKIKIKEPTLDDNIPDLERIARELTPLMESKKPVCSVELLRKIPRIIRETGFDVNLVIREDEKHYEILDVAAQKDRKIYGLCVDIGTTTVAACLVDLSTGEIEASANSGNLQMQYGADVISRIIHSTKPGGLENLHDAIVQGNVNKMIRRMMENNACKPEDIVCSVFAGNTTMTHLFLGVPPENIRLEPYIPAFRNSPVFRAKDIALDINPNAPVYVLPNVASYVGGDIVSGVLAAGFWNSDEVTLFMDLGTNGELVLGNREWMVACACSAGPAFEGGDISCGMRAAPGAIESVRIDNKTLIPDIVTIGNTKPAGICGSGIIDLIAEMFFSGIIDGKGKIKQFSKSCRIRFDRHSGCREYLLVPAEDTENGREIVINEIDIDNFLRAKGAVFSGIKTLLNSVGLGMEDIKKVIVAGGIGQNLDIENSIQIGLLPDIDRSRFEFIGNSSLMGAYLCLISDEARQAASQIAELMTYIELSADPAYMEEFVSACFLPHTDISLFPSVQARI
ncbi:MAG: hypothetical protein PWQ97_828 [Tepidanaerobacteraceae bacterium]|nr:hypothetical protein [Tepidanaerobacteraceae bacterium]